MLKQSYSRHTSLQRDRFGSTVEMFPEALLCTENQNLLQGHHTTWTHHAFFDGQ